MERFNLSFRRTGKFYMEGDISVDMEGEGTMPLSDVIAKAQSQDFTKFYPIKIDYFEDEWQFGRSHYSPELTLVEEKPNGAA